MPIAGIAMKGMRNRKGENGGVTTMDVTGQAPARKCLGHIALPAENLRKGVHEILSPLPGSVTPRVDVTQYLALAWRIAFGFRRQARSRGIDLDDLFGEACLALVYAADGFAATRGATFRTYAWTAMRNGVARAVREQRPHCSLVGADGRVMEPPARPMPDPDAVADVQTLLTGLVPRERELVEKWFGLAGGEVWSVQQLAADYRISPERVRLILERALATLRRRAGISAGGPRQGRPECRLPRPPRGP
jgi:RNA polymerase sigma factor (sigma-70 family)